MDMPFLKLLSFFLLLTSFTVASSQAIPSYTDHNCTITNNFTSDSPYQFNLNTLLLNLYNKAAATDTTPEFYNTTFVPTDRNDAVYGEYMCRGDVPMEVCQDCVQDAANRIASECPNNKEAIIWYEECFLRYSDRSFFSTLHQLPTVYIWWGKRLAVSCPPKRSMYSSSCLPPRIYGRGRRLYTGRRINNSRADAEDFIELNKTLNDAVVEAETSGPAATKNFATKEANLTSLGSLFILVQCTPDLSPQLCSKCLCGLIKLIPTNDTVADGGKIMNPSCNLRFQSYQFYYKDQQPPSNLIFQVPESPSLADWNCSTTKANYTANDPYINNLVSLFDNLNMSSNIIKHNGFYSTSVGNKSEIVYGLFLCRGDVSVILCHECVNEGIKQLNFSCPSSREAIVWFDKCMLRYSNRSFFSTPDTQPTYTKRGADMLQNQTDAGFSRLLASSLNDLVAATPKSVGVKNFETKRIFSPSDLKTLYTLAQCTPNLNSQDCQNCLQDAQQQILSCCLGKKGGQVMNPSCDLRFELYRFYNNYSISAVSVPPAYPPNNSGVLVITGKNRDHSRTIIIAVSLSAASITLFCFGVYFWKRKKSQLTYKAILKKIFGSEGATLESLQFILATIEAATDKFSIENRIGKGGFGEVYMVHKSQES